MAEEGASSKTPQDVLPQVVIADFFLKELPFEIRKVVERLTYTANNNIISLLQSLLEKAIKGDEKAVIQALHLLISYFTERDYPLSTLKEFNLVHEFNELLAWVLAFGRQVNHFALSLHLMERLQSFEDFNSFIEEESHINLNKADGTIKGSISEGIQQSATKGSLIRASLKDGVIDLRECFVDFVWGFPLSPIKNQKYGVTISKALSHAMLTKSSSLFMKGKEYRKEQSPTILD